LNGYDRQCYAENERKTLSPKALFAIFLSAVEYMRRTRTLIIQQNQMRYQPGGSRAGSSRRCTNHGAMFRRPASAQRAHALTSLSFATAEVCQRRHVCTQRRTVKPGTRNHAYSAERCPCETAYKRSRHNALLFRYMKDPERTQTECQHSQASLRGNMQQVARPAAQTQAARGPAIYAQNAYMPGGSLRPQTNRRASEALLMSRTD